LWLKQKPELTVSAEGFRDFLLRLTFMGILDNESIIEYLKVGLEFYKTEKKRIVDDNLSIEKSYFSWDSNEKDRYLFLWEYEYKWILDDVNRKIIWIEQLIEELAANNK
ncbi:MAG: hypothetical protein H6Q64_2306, partial [Firmicutes bacterium]|nr:hypothetical protein [Bacillota bacterium]